MKSQPQNTEFRNNLENFHPCADASKGGSSPIASQGRSVPEFLWKPIATCDFHRGSRHTVPSSLSEHDNQPSKHAMRITFRNSITSGYGKCSKISNTLK